MKLKKKKFYIIFFGKKGISEMTILVIWVILGSFSTFFKILKFKKYFFILFFNLPNLYFKAIIRIG